MDQTVLTQNIPPPTYAAWGLTDGKGGEWTIPKLYQIVSEDHNTQNSSPGSWGRKEIAQKLSDEANKRKTK